MVCEMLVMEEGGFGLSLCLKEDQYDTVIVMAGVNDVNKGQTEEEIVRDIKKLQKVCEKYVKRLVLMSIPNTKKNNVKFDNVKLWELENEKTEYCEFFEFIDDTMLQEDQLHLNDFGKSLCIECLEDVLSDPCMRLAKGSDSQEI